MRILHVGASAYPEAAVAGHLRREGAEVEATGGDDAALERALHGDVPFDAAVVWAALGAGPVRKLARAGGNVRHLVLVSSWEAYPAVARARPWRPDDLDLGDEPGLPTLDARARTLREAERELRLARGDVPWTVVRPSIVEGPEDPSDSTAWFVARVLDGGPVVLPDASPAIHRRVGDDDLARALLLAAGRRELHGKVLHATGNGMLTSDGVARAVMDALERPVAIAWVPERRWLEAGLAPPPGERARGSFLEASPELFALGWKPRDEVERLRERAVSLAAEPRPADAAARTLERRVLHDAEISPEFQPEAGREAPATGARAWLLQAVPGRPASLRFERLSAVPRLPPPLLRTRAVALGEEVERLLGAAPGATPRVPGHNALLELIEPGRSGWAPGTLLLPVAKRPCGPDCRLCADVPPGTVGVDSDGYAAAWVTTPAEHLVQVPPSLEKIALLAQPLARLLEALAEPLKGTGPVWIVGRRAEAALAGFLALDAERPVFHADRVAGGQAPGGAPVWELRQLRQALHEHRVARPMLVVNLSGAREGENIAAAALETGGTLASPFPPPANLRAKALALAPAAGRAALEAALERLARWTAFRDLEALCGPAVAPANCWDALLAANFRQPFLDAGSRP